MSSRTNAAQRDFLLLEEKMKLIHVELREYQRLKVQKEQLYLSFENGKDGLADTSQEIVDNSASLQRDSDLSFLEGKSFSEWRSNFWSANHHDSVVIKFLEWSCAVNLQWTSVCHEADHGPSPRAGHSSVPISCFYDHKVSTFIVVFGGYNGESSFDDVYIFDTGNVRVYTYIDIHKYMLFLCTVYRNQLFSHYSKKVLWRILKICEQITVYDIFVSLTAAGSGLWAGIFSSQNSKWHLDKKSFCFHLLGDVPKSWWDDKNNQL